MVMIMKFIKILIPISLAIVIGYFFGTFIYDQYDRSLMAFNDTKVVYFLQQGVFSNNNNLNDNLSKLDSSLVEEENGKYYVYVGMTGTYEIAEKIKSIYKDKGYVLYIKEKNISNRYFISDLEQYDKLLNSQDNYDNLNEVLKTIIDSYESNVKSS